MGRETGEGTAEDGKARNVRKVTFRAGEKKMSAECANSRGLANRTRYYGVESEEQVKPLRWTSHALQALADRDVDRNWRSTVRICRPTAINDRPITQHPTPITQEDGAMKVIYDRETDPLVIMLRDAPIRESDEVRPGVIADFGEDGGVVRFEVLRASRVVEDAEQVQFTTTG
jgi:uncharacterized protein YuzE